LATRIAAARPALDRGRWPEGALVLRTAPDEAVVIGGVVVDAVDDPHAIVEPETALFGVWMSRADATHHLDRHAAWEWRRHDGGLAQGSVAGVPVSLWLGADRVLWVVPEPFASTLQAALT
jgi:hypothetical protein